MAPPSNPACSQCDAEFMQDLQAHTAPPAPGEHNWCAGCVCVCPRATLRACRRGWKLRRLTEAVLLVIVLMPVSVIVIASCYETPRMMSMYVPCMHAVYSQSCQSEKPSITAMPQTATDGQTDPFGSQGPPPSSSLSCAISPLNGRPAQIASPSIPSPVKEGLLYIVLCTYAYTPLPSDFPPPTPARSFVRTRTSTSQTF